jgi:hypothetical protein
MAERHDDLWEDDIDELLDRRLRAELQAGLGPSEDAYGTLQALAPEFTRAARIRRAQLVLSSAATVLAFAGGAVFATSYLGQGSAHTEAAGDIADGGHIEVDGHLTTIEVEVDGAQDPTVVEVDPSTSGSETSATGEPTTQAGVGEAATDSVATASADSTGSTGGTSSSTPPPTAPSTPTTAQTTRQTTTTRPASTTAAPPSSTGTSLAVNERLVESRCGDIVVRLLGTSVRLVDTFPDTGYSVDVESSGPAEVKVKFSGRSECEVWARFHDGHFTTSDDDGDHDDHDD